MISLSSLKKRNQGFTIVELLIVIVVIGILALLVITTYSGIQAKARNAKRSSDISTIQTQIEAYYQDQGHYPSLDDMNNVSTGNGTDNWVKTNMKSLDQGALIDPSAGSSTDCVKTHVSCFNGSGATANQYGYQPVQSDGTACSADTDCAGYTLTAKYEGTVNGATSVTKNNLD